MVFLVAWCNNINDNHVLNQVVFELRKLSKQNLSDEFFEQFDNFPQENNATDEEIKGVKIKLDETRKIIKNLYVDKLKGIIDESILLEVSSKYSSEMQNLQRRLAELEKLKALPATEHDYKNLIERVANFDVLDKSILMKLIDKIEISKEKEIFMTYNFKNPCN